MINHSLPTVAGGLTGAVPGDIAGGALGDVVGDRGVIVDDVRWLSYSEMGEVLGITPASAKRLAIRRKWSKRPGNDGLTRVAVPVDRIPVKPPVTRDIADGSAGDDTQDTASDDTSDVLSGITETVAILTRHITRLEEEITATRTKVATAEAERDAERARATQVDVLKVQLENEKRRSDELRVERTQAAEQIDALREIIEAERQRHEAALQRLEDAWREQTSAAQRALAEEAKRRGLRSWLRRRA